MSDILIHDEVNNSLNKNGKTASQIFNYSEGHSDQIQSIKHYSIDLDMYDDIFKESNKIQETVYKNQNEYKPYDNLNKDLFLGLYKYKPEIINESNMAKSSIINNRIMKKIAKSDDFNDLRKNTKLELYNSMLGTEIVSEKAKEIITEWKEQVKEQFKDEGKKNPLDEIDSLMEKEEELDELLNEINDLQDELDSLIESNADQDEIDELKDEIDELKDEIDELKEEIEQTSLEIGIDDLLNNKSLSQSLDESLKQINESIEEANKEISQSNSMIESFGWSKEHFNNTQNISFQTKKDLLRKFKGNKKLKEICKILGRLKETAIEEQKRKSKDGATAIKSITLGNDISKVLPSEKVKLINPTTKKDFYRKYSQKELFQYELESHKIKSKGPIICCVDTSGSMSGKRETWSKAVTLAMLEVANIQKRDFACILFSSRAEDPIVIEKGEASYEKIVRIAEEFDCGGTDFTSPLEKSLELIKTSKFKKADIVFITDGEDSIKNSFIEYFNRIKVEKEFTVHSILIGHNPSCLQLFSDKITNYNDFNIQNENDNNLKEIFSI